MNLAFRQFDWRGRCRVRESPITTFNGSIERPRDSHWLWWLQVSCGQPLKCPCLPSDETWTAMGWSARSTFDWLRTAYQGELDRRWVHWFNIDPAMSHFTLALLLSNENVYIFSYYYHTPIHSDSFPYPMLPLPSSPDQAGLPIFSAYLSSQLLLNSRPLLIQLPELPYTYTLTPAPSLPSIPGNKKDNITIIYTPWSNLHKNASMSTGQVSFHNPRLTRKILVPTRLNPIINRLNKTRSEKYPDLQQEREDEGRRKRNAERKVREQQKQKEKEEKRQREELRWQKDHAYDDLMSEENLRASSNLDRASDWEDDFM